MKHETVEKYLVKSLSNWDFLLPPSPVNLCHAPHKYLNKNSKEIIHVHQNKLICQILILSKHLQVAWSLASPCQDQSLTVAAEKYNRDDSLLFLQTYK